MKQITCVFFGRSGSGKGTQADLLLKYLAGHDSKRKAIYIETGRLFRNFMDSGTYTAKKVKENLAAGKLLPVFLPIWVWTGLLNDEYTGKEHLVFDGVSRRLEEAKVLDAAMQFYERERPTILFLELHNEKGTERLLKRGRYDDEREKINERMKWFEDDVMPVVDYFKKNPHYNFVIINGDQTIPEVFEDVKKAIGI